MSLNNLLKIHKKAIFQNGFSVDCILKPYNSHAGYSLKGMTSFIGLTVEDNGIGAFADSFQLTINLDELFELQGEKKIIPTRNWNVGVKLPQMYGDKFVDFKVENVAVDRTLGMCLFGCSALTTTGNPKAVQRQSTGGM